jgi:hypothetical protein
MRGETWGHGLAPSTQKSRENHGAPGNLALPCPRMEHLSLLAKSSTPEMQVDWGCSEQCSGRKGTGLSWAAAGVCVGEGWSGACESKKRGSQGTPQRGLVAP